MVVVNATNIVRFIMKILPFSEASRRNPLHQSRDDAKVVLMLCADLLSDDISSGMTVEKDIDLYNQIQEHLADIDIHDSVMRDELVEIVSELVERYDAFSDVDCVLLAAQDDFRKLTKSNKYKLLQAFGKQSGGLPDLPELDSNDFE